MKLSQRLKATLKHEQQKQVSESKKRKTHDRPIVQMNVIEMVLFYRLLEMK